MQRAGKDTSDYHNFKVGDKLKVVHEINSNDSYFQSYNEQTKELFGKIVIVSDLLNGTLNRHCMQVTYVDDKGVNNKVVIYAWACEKYQGTNIISDDELPMIKRLAECVLENTNSRSLYDYASGLLEKIK